MRPTQSSVSFLPELTPAQIAAQIECCRARGWALAIEYTHEEHARNTGWEMYGDPMLDLDEPCAMHMAIDNCRKSFQDRYVRVTGFDPAHGPAAVVMRFLVHRPREEMGFRLIRTQRPARWMNDTADAGALCRRSMAAL